MYRSRIMETYIKGPFQPLLLSLEVLRISKWSFLTTSIKNTKMFIKYSALGPQPRSPASEFWCQIQDLVFSKGPSGDLNFRCLVCPKLLVFLFLSPQIVTFFMYLMLMTYEAVFKHHFEISPWEESIFTFCRKESDSETLSILLKLTQLMLCQSGFASMAVNSKVCIFSYCA